MDVLRRRRSGTSASGGARHEGALVRRVPAALRAAGLGAGVPRDAGRPADAGLGLPRARGARRAGASCSRASSAASGSRATRSSAAIPWLGSRCAAARCSSGTPRARTRPRPGCSARCASGSAPPPAEIPDLPRFTGGVVGYLTYDAARLFERLPDRHGAAQGTLASFSLYRSLVAFDHVRQRLVLIAHAAPGSRARVRPAHELLDALRAGPGAGSAGRRTRAAPTPPAALPFARRRALPRGGAARQGAHRARRHLPGRALARSTRSTAASTRSASTARCAWSTRRPTCTS